MSEPNSAFEYYEKLAEDFYKETGLIAPGKDAAAGSGQPDYDVRWAKFQEWLTRRDE